MIHQFLLYISSSDILNLIWRINVTDKLFTLSQILMQFGNIEFSFSRIKMSFNKHGVQQEDGIVILSFQW